MSESSCRPKVLVIDDEADIRAQVSAILEDDYDVVEADGYDSGIAKAKGAAPRVIVLDVCMPGKDGFEVFRTLSDDDATKTIPVIMLTGVADATGLRFSAEEMGEYFGRQPSTYLEKPVNPNALLEAVKKALGGGCCCS